MGQEHDEDGIGDNHAGGRFIGELGIELETELGKERDRVLEAFHWQIDENLSSHDLFVMNGYVVKNKQKADDG
jgi:hypothetical protein